MIDIVGLIEARDPKQGACGPYKKRAAISKLGHYLCMALLARPGYDDPSGTI